MDCSSTPTNCASLWTAPASNFKGMTIANGVVFVTDQEGVQAHDAAGSENCSGGPKVCAPLWPTNTHTTTGPAFQRPASGDRWSSSECCTSRDTGGSYVAAFDTAGSTGSGSPTGASRSGRRLALPAAPEIAVLSRSPIVRSASQAGLCCSLMPPVRQFRHTEGVRHCGQPCCRAAHRRARRMELHPSPTEPSSSRPTWLSSRAPDGRREPILNLRLATSQHPSVCPHLKAGHLSILAFHALNSSFVSTPGEWTQRAS